MNEAETGGSVLRASKGWSAASLAGLRLLINRIELP
jgi:hypothetical protein